MLKGDEASSFAYVYLVNRRKVIVTELESVGLSPIWCQKGNVIAIFHGCSVPISVPILVYF